jgi:hypothetical protein
MGAVKDCRLLSMEKEREEKAKEEEKVSQL